MTSSPLAPIPPDTRRTAVTQPADDFSDMYERAYFGVQKVLDRALGKEWGDGAGSGIVADVDLLARRYERALNALYAVVALTQDTDGGQVDGDANIPIGEIRRVLAEARFLPAIDPGARLSAGTEDS
jgi:hypothetical protein